MTDGMVAADVSLLRIVGIFISPEHNFFGHHERPARTHRSSSVDEIECCAGKDSFGDRFFGLRNGGLCVGDVLTTARSGESNATQGMLA